MTQCSWPRDVKELLRDRILSAAGDELCATGWGPLTVAAVARRAGVRRQGVYEEIGTKADLGRALVEREARTHLTAIAGRVRSARTPSDGLVDAADLVLRDVARDRLVVAALGTPGRAPEPQLVAVLTSAPEVVLVPALAVVTEAVAEAFPTVARHRVAVACAVVVRLSLSHLLQPLGPVDDALGEVRAVAEALLPPE